ncbi:MAG TPA: hypothetical protein VIK53_05710 [Verrucomicrobiae bacterium]
MLTWKMKRSDFGRSCRSGFHHVITPAPVIKHIVGAKFDNVGGVIVIGLSGGILILMRLLLT